MGICEYRKETSSHKVSETRKTWKKKSDGGQKGIVSCIATHPTIPNVYAVGTYRGVKQDSGAV